MVYVILLLLILFLVSHSRLRESHKELEKKLKHIEDRIDQLDSEADPKAAAKPDVEVPESVARKKSAKFAAALKKSPKSKPPPLPPADTASQPEPVSPPQTAAAVTEEKLPAPKPTAPSFFERIPWRNYLERIHLWPPSRTEAGESAEIQLAAWWTARVGLVFLILTAVWFGIYVSLNTPPWLRVFALFLISCGTIGLGAQMKDKLEGFGRAIIGGGFALLYFTAFAAFALPATKIIYSPTIGILSQLAALIVAIVWSLWKKDQTIATLTIMLGYIACGFSHTNNLDRSTLVGLVLLAATGAFLFTQRGWLIAFITSLAGSWIGYALFALLDWRNGDSPSFVILLGTLVTLTVLFEVGNLVGIARRIHPLSDRWRRWLILSNTSAAALLGYGVTRLIYPDDLSTFYFVFASLYFAFTAIHYLRSTDEALTQTLFLKTSALLCLGFAAAFDGPVRWLAIAFQSFALLWTARRSGSRWIALGFAVVFVVSLGWFWRDIIVEPPKEWLWLETFRIAGSFYLVFLTVQLTIHALWFPSGIGGISATHQSQARGARTAGALAIGLSAIFLAQVPDTRGVSDPLWFLLILSATIAAVCPATRRVLPCFAAAPPLLFTYLAYAFLSHLTSQTTAALILGLTLIALAFGITEIIRRFWPRKIDGSGTSRGLVLLTGLITLLPFTYALTGRLSISNNAAMGVFALIPLVTTAALLSRYQLIHDGTRSRAMIGFYVVSGLIVFIGGLIICQGSDYFSSALTLSSLPLLVVLFKIQSRRVALAGTIPLLGGFLFLWLDLLKNGSDQITHDSINLAITLVASIGIAVVLWKRITSPSLLKLASFSDVALHGLAIFSIHLFFQKHLAQGADFFASALLGIILLVISRRFPFRSLAFVSWLPITLAFFSGLLNGIWWGEASGQVWFWLAGLIVLIHLLLSNLWMIKEDQLDSTLVTDTLRFRFQPLVSLITVSTWTLIVVSATTNPWHAAALAGTTLLCSGLWRWRKIEWIESSGLAPLTLSAFISLYILWVSNPVSSSSQDLLSVFLVAIGITINGIMLATARLQHNLLTSSNILPWLHAGTALLIAFVACSTDRLVSDNLTTVFWGISAITLWISGLFTGLRAYRLMGLIGILPCIPRIIFRDIQDPGYRIFAALAISLVLLAIAFLYNHYRDRIAALDKSNKLNSA